VNLMVFADPLIFAMAVLSITKLEEAW
jgi:hypothetical protein